MNKTIKLTISIFLSLSAGAIGSIFTLNSIPSWYSTLNKPVFNPPNYLFGPVWTTLYVLMGISLYLIWENKKRNKTAFIIFGTQLLLNALWSILFFGLRNPLAAFIEIILLWTAILYTIIIFYKIDKNTTYLLLPYILWVSFAAVLNFYLLILN